MPLPPATYIPTAQDIWDTTDKYEQRRLDPPPVLKQAPPRVGAFISYNDSEKLDHELSLLVRLAQVLTTDCEIHRKKGVINASRFSEEEEDAVWSFIRRRRAFGPKRIVPLTDKQIGARFPIKELEHPKDESQCIARDIAMAMLENWDLYHMPDYHEITVSDLSDWAWGDRLPEDTCLALSVAHDLRIKGLYSA